MAYPVYIIAAVISDYSFYGVAVKRSLLRLVLMLFLILTCGQAGASEIRDFSSDGCSLFPDGTVLNMNLWCDCCFEHDIAYWRGGTEDERKQADRALRECVRERTGNSALAEMMYEGVRAGGHPAFPTWYRWAYGWKYGRGYDPLTEPENQQAAEKLAEYKKSHPFGYCRRK